MSAVSKELNKYFIMDEKEEHLSGLDASDSDSEDSSETSTRDGGSDMESLFGGQRRLEWKNPPVLLMDGESIVEVLLRMQEQIETLQREKFTSPPSNLDMNAVLDEVDTRIQHSDLNSSMSAMKREIDTVWVSMDSVREEMIRFRESVSRLKGSGLTKSNKIGALKRNSTMSKGGLSQKLDINGTANDNAEESKIPTLKRSFSENKDDDGEDTDDYNPIFESMEVLRKDQAYLRGNVTENRDMLVALQNKMSKNVQELKHVSSMKDGPTASSISYDKRSTTPARSTIGAKELKKIKKKNKKLIKTQMQRMMREIQKVNSALKLELETQSTTNKTWQETSEEKNTKALSTAKERVVTIEKRLQTIAHEILQNVDQVRSDFNQELESSNNNVIGLSDDITHLQHSTEEQYEALYELIEGTHVEMKTLVVVGDEKESRFESKLNQITASIDEHSSIFDKVQNNLQVMKVKNEKSILQLEKELTRNYTDAVQNKTDIQALTQVQGDDHRTLSVALELQRTLNKTTFEVTQTALIKQGKVSDDIRLKCFRGHDALQANVAEMKGTLNNNILSNQINHENLSKMVFGNEKKINETTVFLDRTISTVEKHRTKHVSEYDGIIGQITHLKVETNERKDEMEKVSLSFVHMKSEMKELQNKVVSDLNVSHEHVVSLVEKESLRTEALYESFQEKQKRFTRMIANASVRNLSSTEMLSELGKISTKIAEDDLAMERSPHVTPITTAIFSERIQQSMVKNALLVSEIILAKCEYDIFKNALGHNDISEQEFQIQIVSAQYAMAEKWLTSVEKKISDKASDMHDETMLAKRRVYLIALQHILDAALAKRSFPMQFLENHFHSSDSLLHAQPTADDFSLTNTGVKGTKAKRPLHSTSLPRKNLLNEIIPLHEGATVGGMRPIHVPSSEYIYRGGFRLPRRSNEPFEPPSLRNNKQILSSLNDNTLSPNLETQEESRDNLLELATVHIPTTTVSNNNIL